MFAILLIGGTGVILKVSSGDKSLATNSISARATGLKFDLNTY
tara:strand:- start:220 stop:348 length:129 start_codon:yes stop_codon:yes gene_type:complete